MQSGGRYAGAKSTREGEAPKTISLLIPIYHLRSVRKQRRSANYRPICALRVIVRERISAAPIGSYRYYPRYPLLPIRSRRGYAVARRRVKSSRGDSATIPGRVRPLGGRRVGGNGVSRGRRALSVSIYGAIRSGDRRICTPNRDADGIYVRTAGHWAKREDCARHGARHAAAALRRHDRASLRADTRVRKFGGGGHPRVA